MKRLFSLFLALILLTGCAGNRANRNLEVWTDTTFFLRTDPLDETRTYPVHLDRETDLIVKTETRSGTMHMEIARPGESPDYQGNLTEDFSFTLHLIPGEYTLTLAGSRHQGTILLDWGK